MVSDPENALEYVGLTLEDANDLAVRHGMIIRNRSPLAGSTGEVGAFMDDLRSDRVNLWLDDDGHVARAEIF